MTEPLFREDAYLREAEATVEAVDVGGGIVLDRTIFYPQGGGQPGDRGELVLDDGSRLIVVNTTYGSDRRTILHALAEGSPSRRPARGFWRGSTGICASSGCAPIRRSIC
jgi:misacylated tRNA(Ala) deacylase